VIEQARHFAGRVFERLGEDRSRVDCQVTKAFELALGRPPSEEERSRAVAFLHDDAAQLGRSADLKKDLPVPTPRDLTPVQAAALVDFCHVLFNLNEFVYVD
jgi:hypothetical protein